MSESTWAVQHRHGSAQELHDRGADDPIAGRAVVIQHVVAPALVLGSTQPDRDVDRTAVSFRGWELARRRSGGGAVLLVPGEHVWVDLVVPAGDPLAEDDVEQATWWVGRAWARALGLGPVIEGPTTAVGGAVPSADARADKSDAFDSASTSSDGTGVSDHPGASAAGRTALLHLRGVSDRAAGRAACFAAIGPGELSVDGRKVLGISQRRTRFGARFQCVAYSRWDPEPLIEVLAATSGAEWGERSEPASGAGWGERPMAAAVRATLSDRAGAVLLPGWDVVEHLVPALP